MSAASLPRRWLRSLRLRARGISGVQIDAPKSIDRDFGPQGIRLAGKFQVSSARQLRLLFQWFDTAEFILFDGWVETTCEFEFWMHPHAHRSALFVEDESGRRRLLTEIQTTELRKQGLPPGSDIANAFAGKQGWLFLQRDRNSSRAQATGIMRLTAEGRAGWQSYGRGLQGLTRNPGNTLMLVAPLKERVMAAYYPEPIGAQRVLDEVRQALGSVTLVTAEDRLAALGDQGFQPTDTHWSHRGAAEAFIEACRAFGLDSQPLDAILENAQWQVRQATGDLGNKVTPRMSGPVEYPDFRQWQDFRRYENGVKNFGRVIVLENPDALNGACCLIFGSSSTYFFLGFAARVFRRIVVVHTSGSVDPAFVEYERPDHILLQTSERFMVRPASADYSVYDEIERKKIIDNLQVAPDRILALPDTDPSAAFYAKYLP